MPATPTLNNVAINFTYSGRRLLVSATRIAPTIGRMMRAERIGNET
jgi:hypothetical protein